MDFHSLEDWLKNTIWGIITLGVISSYVAVMISRVITKIIYRILPASVNRVVGFEYRRTYIRACVMAMLIEKNDLPKLIVSFSYFVVNLIVASILSTLFFVIFLTLVSTNAVPPLTIGSYLSISLFFISLYWAYTQYLFIHHSFYLLLDPLFKEASDEFKKKGEIDFIEKMIKSRKEKKRGSTKS